MKAEEIAELGRLKEIESGERRRLAVYAAALVALPRLLEERRRLLESLSTIIRQRWMTLDQLVEAKDAIAFAEAPTTPPPSPPPPPESQE